MCWLRFVSTLVICLFVFTPLVATGQEDNSCNNKIDCAANSVVSLLPDWPANFTRNEEPEGSGIVLGNGTLIATADHVLGPARSARIRTRGGRILKARVVLRDVLTDVALLKISEALIPFEKIVNTFPGNEACAIGNSFGLDISVTCGVVSATQVSGVGFNQIEDFVQTDTAVNPGMSGGALIDKQGNLLGLLSAIFTKGSDANLGVNFAVSSKLLFVIVDDYTDDQKVALRRSGVLARPSRPLEIDGRIGIEVVRILPDTPEEESELKLGDVILFAGNRRIKNLADYGAAIATASNEKEINLLVWREGNEFNITIKQ